MKFVFRIVTLIFLVLSLSLSVCTALEAKEKTYEEGKTYRLTEEKIDLSGLYVYAPAHICEGLGLPADGREGLVKIGVYEDVFEEELTPRYASDDLSTIMFDNLVCLRNGRLIITGPSYTRGAEDTYGVFKHIAGSAYFYRNASRSGMTFSGDGRYALLIDGYQALITMQFQYQLIILDVEAGEWYLGYTWPTKIMNGGECVVGACFDEANEYIYIKAYGDAYGARQSFLRYHIESGEMEHLNSNDIFSAYQNMFRTPDGTYVYELTPRYSHQPGGLVEYKEIGGKWFACPNFYHTRTAQLHVQNLDVSSINGQALVLNNLSVPNTAIMEEMPVSRPINVLSLPVIRDGVHNLQELIYFNQEVNKAERISAGDYIQRESELTQETLNRPVLYNAALSPDGNYVFAVFNHPGADSRFSARILNTETLALSNISFEEGTFSIKSAFGNPMGLDYAVGIQMIANDLVIINTESGVRLFRIE